MRTKIIVSLALLSAVASAAVVSRIYTFSDGSILTAAQLNDEFNNVIDNVNSLDNDNISAGANIAPSKIASTIAGDGLSRDASTGVLSVSPDDVTIELNSDQVRIKDAGVTTAKINDLAVTTGKIADLAVTTAKIDALSVTAAKLAADSVTESKIINGAVSTDKIAGGAVTASKIQALSVTFDKLYSRPTGTGVAEGGVMMSASTGVNSFTSAETLATATLTVSSSVHPIFIGLINNEPSNPGSIQIPSTGYATFYFRIDGSNVSINYSNDSGGGRLVPCSHLSTIVTTTAGARSISIVGESSATAGIINYCKLVAYEL